MAGLPQEKLKQMEAEMDRFEQEISEQPGSIGRFIIGTHTFTHMQEKLKGPGHPGALPPPPPPPPMGGGPPSMSGGPPPMGGGPPSMGGGPPPNSAPDGPIRPMQPPPPPPLIRPAFTPPQIRQRAPFRPPPPPPPMGGPPPRPPPGFGPPRGGGGPPPFNSQPPPRQFYSSGPTLYSKPPSTTTPSPAVVEKPRVVYSAPPVRNIPKEPEKPKLSESKPEEKKTETDEPPPKQAKMAAPGIELNVPIQEIVAEHSVSASTAADMAEASVMMPDKEKSKKEKKKKSIRMAAGQTWEDPSLTEWNPDDFRIFCGDLGNEVTDELLARAFSKYPSFQRAKVIRDKRTNKTRGYGFVSFRDPNDFMRGMREMNGKYVGNRPIKLRKSTWKDRNIDIVKKKEKEKKRLGLR